MTGRQDPVAAGGDRLRAGHFDRERVIEALLCRHRGGRSHHGVRGGHLVGAAALPRVAAEARQLGRRHQGLTLPLGPLLAWAAGMGDAEEAPSW